MTTGEIVAVVSAIVASLALAFNVLKDRRNEVLTSQGVRDKLDYISDTARDISESDLSRRVPETGNDDITALPPVKASIPAGAAA